MGIPQGGVVGYTDVSTDSEQAMMSAVAQQPVSIAIEAETSTRFSCTPLACSPLHAVRVSTMVFWPSVTEVRRAQTTGR